MSQKQKSNREFFHRSNLLFVVTTHRGHHGKSMVACGPRCSHFVPIHPGMLFLHVPPPCSSTSKPPKPPKLLRLQASRALMDTSQHLPSESFSYSWLASGNPALESLNDSLRFSDDAFDTGSFIEMDPNLMSRRWARGASDFDFNLPDSQPLELVTADEIFSNGLLLPLHIATMVKKSDASLESALSRSLSWDSSKSLLSQSSRRHSRYFNDANTIPVSGDSSPVFFHSARSSPMSFRSISSKSAQKLSMFSNCMKSPKKILCKYLYFLKPLCKKVKSLKLSARSTKIYNDSAESSPRTSSAYTVMFDVHSESIHDAVLYCKNSMCSFP